MKKLWMIALAACCVLAMLPIIALYIFLNKYFIKGAVDSAVK